MYTSLYSCSRYRLPFPGHFFESIDSFTRGSQSHIDYVVEIILDVWRRRGEIRGYELIYQAPFLRHFTARLRSIIGKA